MTSQKKDENRIFVDTNILIGCYFPSSNKGRNERKSLSIYDKSAIQYLYSLKGKRLFTSSLAIAQLVSVFQKKMTNEQIIDVVQQISAKFEIISFTKEDVLAAIDSQYANISTDLEDNIQYIISSKMRCFYFVTNNKSDYTQFYNIKSLTARSVREIDRD